MDINSRNRLILATAVAAFVLNYAWEMAQMPFYLDMPFNRLDSWLLCLRAALGDVFIIIAVFLAGRLVFKVWNWIRPLTIWRAVLLFGMGGGIALLIEWQAISTGRWYYSLLMPTVAAKGIGIVPLAQMLILPYISIRLGMRLADEGRS